MAHLELPAPHFYHGQRRAQRESGGLLQGRVHIAASQCPPVNLPIPELSHPGKPETASANGFPRSLTRRLEPNFSPCFP